MTKTSIRSPFEHTGPLAYALCLYTSERKLENMNEIRLLGLCCSYKERTLQSGAAHSLNH